MDLIERALTSESSKTTCPQYNIEKKADETYRILVAVAGFSTNDILVEVKENAVFLAEKNLRLVTQAAIYIAESRRDLLNAASKWPITFKWSQPVILTSCCTSISKVK